MREIVFEQAVRAVEQLCLEAAFDLPKDVLAGLGRSLETEPSPLGRSLLGVQRRTLRWLDEMR